uniref:S-adenosylmethionine mitochondrial carrier protein n=2 Tax=Panagrellus redivivus TaxID=6233 RepID=A0A7E4W4T4_PANRE
MEGYNDVVRWLVCGATAGLSVDLSLYPIDTIKTRLQSEQGFLKAGGFKNVYRGMSSVAVGSAPGAAVFFTAYYAGKKVVTTDSPIGEALRASLAEIAACLIRVPTEVLKQRAQTATAATTLSGLVRQTYQTDGFRGFYRGYLTTVFREIPFSFIEFPIWEFLKRRWAAHKNRDKCKPFESAVCGSIAGSFSAAVTTPLDVAKTRVMLYQGPDRPSALKMLRQVYTQEGPAKLFAGAVPRTIWMGVGGYVFFFAFEFSQQLSLHLF